MKPQSNRKTKLLLLAIGIAGITFAVLLHI